MSKAPSDWATCTDDHQDEAASSSSPAKRCLHGFPRQKTQKGHLHTRTLQSPLAGTPAMCQQHKNDWLSAQRRGGLQESEKEVPGDTSSETRPPDPPPADAQVPSTCYRTLTDLRAREPGEPSILKHGTTELRIKKCQTNQTLGNTLPHFKVTKVGRGASKQLLKDM